MKMRILVENLVSSFHSAWREITEKDLEEIVEMLVDSSLTYLKFSDEKGDTVIVRGDMIKNSVIIVQTDKDRNES